MKYIKQLDSLRAIAVLFVIVHHWVANNIFNRITNGSIGSIGVDIFFVLSGFLITKILFDNRNEADKSGISKSIVIKNFYIRRTLRIFPIYYLTIFLLLIFHKHTGSNIKSAFIYFVTYTSNFYFFKVKAWEPMISHLWSLAVEEQFYLIWPWIILFANKKYYLHIIICFIMVGILSQYLMRDIKLFDFVTFTCFDAFGLGALLSWQITFNTKMFNRFYAVVSIFAFAAFIFFVIGVKQQNWAYVPIRTIVSVIALWIITYIVSNAETGSLKLKIIFNNRILIFLGKISYGIYLYHEIYTHFIYKLIIEKYVNSHLPYFLKDFMQIISLAENFIILVLISWLSYVLIEKRFLSLKKFFENKFNRNTQLSLVKAPA